MINTDLILENELYNSANEPVSRLDFVQSQFDWYRTLLYPFGLAVASVFAVPLVNNWIAQYRTIRRIRRENYVKTKEFGDLLKTTEEYRILETQLKTVNENYKDSIENKRRVVDELEKERKQRVAIQEENVELKKKKESDLAVITQNVNIVQAYRKAVIDVRQQVAVAKQNAQSVRNSRIVSRDRQAIQGLDSIVLELNKMEKTLTELVAQAG